MTHRVYFLNKVDSSDRRNGDRIMVSRGTRELGGCSPPECLSRAVVEAVLDDAQGVDAVSRQIGALREALAQQADGVLVRAALPWAGRARG